MLEPQLDQSTIVKFSHTPQKGGNRWVVDVCYFGVVHKTVDDASMCVLHGGGAVKVAAVAD